jgi:hypothetical protein
VKEDDVLTNDLIFNSIKIRITRLRDLENLWNSMLQITHKFKWTLKTFVRFEMKFCYFI